MSKFEKGIMIYYVFFGFFAAVFGIVVMCMPVVQRIEITERILSLAYWVIYPSYYKNCKKATRSSICE